MLQLINAILRALCPEDRQILHEDPVLWDVFINGRIDGAFTAIYALYSCHRDVVQRTPLLRDPMLLSQLDQAFGKDWEKCGRGSIWQMANTQKHTIVNGSLRPVREWRK